MTWSQPSWRTPNGRVSVLKNEGKGQFVFTVTELMKNFELDNIAKLMEEF